MKLAPGELKIKAHFCCATAHADECLCFSALKKEEIRNIKSSNFLCLYVHAGLSLVETENE